MASQSVIAGANCRANCAVDTRIAPNVNKQLAHNVVPTRLDAIINVRDMLRDSGINYEVLSKMIGQLFLTM